MKNTGARFVLMLLIICLMLSSCSLNREHIELPDVNDIEAVSIEYFNTESIVVETDSAIERIYDSLSSARAVRTEKDIPTGGSFFTITIFDAFPRAVARAEASPTEKICFTKRNVKFFG